MTKQYRTDPLQRAQMRKRTAKRKEEGKCNGCDNPPEPGNVYCLECRDKQYSLQKTLYQTRIEQKLCTRCGSKDLVTSRRCQRCREYGNELQRKSYHKSKEVTSE